MELKVIIYIIGAVIYFLYTLSKKKDNEVNQHPSQPKKKTVFDEMIEEWNKAQNPTPKPILKPIEKKSTTINKQLITRGKDIFITEEVNKNFEEGMSAYKIFTEPVFDEGGRIVATDSLEVEELERTNPDFEFDARQAIIYSTILERKF